jgi:hypothetical protein
VRGAGARRARRSRRAAVERRRGLSARAGRSCERTFAANHPKKLREKRMRTRHKRGEEGGSSQGGMRHLGVAVSMIRGPSLFRCRIISKGLGSSFRQLEYTHWKSPFGQIQSFVTFLLSHRHISVAKRRKLCRTCGQTARQGAVSGFRRRLSLSQIKALQHSMNKM